MIRIRFREFLPALLLATLVPPASADLVSPFDPDWVSGTHLTSPHTIYVYTWPQSVKPGDTLSVYVSSISPTVSIRFKRVGTGESYIFDATGQHHTGVPAGVQGVPDETGTTTGVWSVGCGWQPTLRVVVPATWSSAPYLVEVAPEDGEPESSRQYSTFVVRPTTPRAYAAVVVCSSTWHAYQAWGGRSLYDSGVSDRTSVVSLLRPNERNDGRGNFATRDQPWVRLLAQHGVFVEYLTMEDLEQQGHSVLDPYVEVIVIGHSEYWSDRQRDAVEDYIHAGGNVFFATGNTCYWRVEYTPDLQQMICFKGDNIINADGGIRDIPAGEQINYGPLGPNPVHTSTYYWRAAPCTRSAASMTGVDFDEAQSGATNIDGQGTPSDWTVQRPEHWAFEGTGLQRGDRLGATHLVGDEVDGIPLTWAGTPESQFGIPEVAPGAYALGTPESFEILATAEAAQFSHTFLQRPRWAVMGTYQRNGEGCVVTWPQQLLGYEVSDPGTYNPSTPAFSRIALNVVNKLMAPITPVPPDTTTSVGAVSVARLHASLGPNPCSSGGSVPEVLRFALPRPASYDFEVTDLEGRIVSRSLGDAAAGPHEIDWRLPESAPAGVFFWSLTAGGERAAGKLVRIR